MKKSILSMLLLSLITVLNHAEASAPILPKNYHAKLNNATVYFKGAELTHTVSINLNKGENQIKIDGLSPVIDKNSLKIKVSKGAIVTSSQFSTDFLYDSKQNPEVKKLQDSIDICNNRLSQVKRDIIINSDLADILKKGINQNVSGTKDRLSLDELYRNMEYYKNKAVELQKLLEGLNKNKEELTVTLQRLDKQLAQESLKNNKMSGILNLAVTSPITMPNEVTISYFTSSAVWVPYYDINIESTEKPIIISSKAKIRQTTGLDWDKVKLTLSTAMPSNGKIAPLFNTWFLTYYSGNLTSRNMKMASDKRYKITNDEIAYDYYADQALADESFRLNDKKINSSTEYLLNGEPIDSEYINSLDPDIIKNRQYLDNGVINILTKTSMDDYLSLADNQISMSYNIDMPFSIPGNGKEQSIDLQTRQAQANYKYYCAPKLDTETYLIADITDWQNLALLSGKANITYDGTYMGETDIDPLSTKKDLSMTLGTDNRVVVKREKLEDFSSTKFLGNDVKKVLTYKITVKNNRSNSVKMEMKDQYPRSTQKDIEVELLKETTPWNVNDEESGVISWEDTLQAGETKIYKISYSVKYPKNASLNL